MTDRNTLWDEINAALVAFDASKPYRYKPQTKLPALSPQMQAALDAEDEAKTEMVAKVLRRAREIDAELLTARAEIERLKAELIVAQDQTVALKIAGARLLDQIDRSNWVEQDTGFGHTLANNQRLYEFRTILHPGKCTP